MIKREIIDRCNYNDVDKIYGYGTQKELKQ